MNLIEATLEALNRSMVDINSPTATYWDIIEVEQDKQYILLSSDRSLNLPTQWPTLRVCRGGLNAYVGTTLPMTQMASILEIARKAAQ